MFALLFDSLFVCSIIRSCVCMCVRACVRVCVRARLRACVYVRAYVILLLKPQNLADAFFFVQGKQATRHTVPHETTRLFPFTCGFKVFHCD